ncbi:25454_t:CDS:2 [Dentiscutata erythropus]|uniref:25454_t:CDS:1 n=1 Tax=Dentiscutata erythropus TaxID=1348616 RepID=A0A9N9BWD9_9GLOM|nr:25454_t:CDS:2 [Dentiscutata erythropus]
MDCYFGTVTNDVSSRNPLFLIQLSVDPLSAVKYFGWPCLIQMSNDAALTQLMHVLIAEKNTQNVPKKLLVHIVHHITSSVLTLNQLKREDQKRPIDQLMFLKITSREKEK